MDSITPNNAPQNQMGPTPQPTMSPQHAGQKGSMGPIVGIIIIIILLAAGGFYFYQSEQEKAATKDAATQEQASSSPDQQAQTTSSSDATTAIESDLNATDLGSSQADLQGAASAF